MLEARLDRRRIRMRGSAFDKDDPSTDEGVDGFTCIVSHPVYTEWHLLVIYGMIIWIMA